MQDDARSEFRIQFDGFAIEAEAVERLTKVVQRTVLAEIARLDLVRDDFIVRFPEEWLGIWIRHARFRSPEH